MTSLVKAIKGNVSEWKDKNYPGISDVTRRLLEFWFKEEHFLPEGSPFSFWKAQKEAVETLIYIYEVCKCHRLYYMAQYFDVSVPIDPRQDKWPRYAFKMATGSGKTFVMTMAILWQYFNKIYETENGVRYTTHFLLLAPNLIVMDRLYGDEKNEAFGNSRLFYKFPFLPPEWEKDFDLQVVLQNQQTPITSKGVLWITNIQQLYERGEEPPPFNPIDSFLGPKPKKDEESEVPLIDKLSELNDLMILNDEAHHVHSPELKWWEVIAKLDNVGNERFGQGIVAQLDFSATPYFLGTEKVPFPHIIYDYPLGEAIRDGIVKRPHIGEIENPPPTSSKDFVKQHRVQIDVGIEIFEEFKKEFTVLKKKPVLFIMTDQTRNADKVAKYLEEERGFKGKVLVIHTDKEGNITKKALDKAREAARQIDTNEYEAIVSVMMLKEGWDVKNVCVIVPLRSFASQILVEQTLGRGLRRIFPDQDNLEERLIVIEHPRFRQLWEAEIKEGELNIPIINARNVYKPQNVICVDPDKFEFDIEIPILEGGVVKRTPDFNKIKVEQLPQKVFEWEKIVPPTTKYKEKDLLEKKVVREKILAFDYAETYGEYLMNMAKAITSRVGGRAADLIPIIKEYIENRLFNQKVQVQNDDGTTLPGVMPKLNYIPVREKIFDVFVKFLLKLSKDETAYQIVRTFKISDTLPFETSEPVYKCKKTVFNQLPYPKRSTLELEFMVYLDDLPEVSKWSKILSRFPLKIPYYGEDGLIHFYRPDFIVVTEEKNYLIELKGTGFVEMLSIKAKDRSAKAWCENVSKLSGEKWTFLRIDEDTFNKGRTLPFNQLIELLSPPS